MINTMWRECGRRVSAISMLRFVFSDDNFCSRVVYSQFLGSPCDCQIIHKNLSQKLFSLLNINKNVPFGRDDDMDGVNDHRLMEWKSCCFLSYCSYLIIILSLPRYLGQIQAFQNRLASPSLLFPNLTNESKFNHAIDENLQILKAI